MPNNAKVETFFDYKASLYTINGAALRDMQHTGKDTCQALQNKVGYWASRSPTEHPRKQQQGDEE